MIAMAPHLRSIVDDDGAVILDIPRHAMTTLDSTGAYVWQKLDKGVHVKEIVEELVRETGADRSVITKDIGDFINQLRASHLVIDNKDSHSTEDPRNG